MLTRIAIVPALAAAFVGLILSLLVHGLSLAGVNLMDFSPPVWLLHIAAMVVFGLSMALSCIGRGSTTDKRSAAASLGEFLHGPNWIKAMTGIFFAYAMLNFVVFLVLTEGGGPEEVDGRLLLTDHGHVIRELTRAEFESHQANVIRGFSGHWMLFFSAAILMLTSQCRRRGWVFRRTARTSTPHTLTQEAGS